MCGGEERKKLKIFLIAIILLISASSCSYLFYQPSKEVYYDPKSFDLQYQEVSFLSEKLKTDDNNYPTPKLNGWVFYPQQMANVAANAAANANENKNEDKKNICKGTVVYFHGNGENITTHFLGMAWLARAGYSVFIFDYRGYGKSEGDPDQNGLYHDALSALTYGQKLHLEKCKTVNPQSLFIVFGQSLGGVVSLRAIMDYNLRSQIDLVVIDSSFSSYQNIAFDKLTSFWFTWLFSPLAYLLVSDEMEVKSMLGKFDRPLLVIHGTADTLVPFKFGKQIFDLAGEELSNKIPSQISKWWWPSEGGQHIDFFWIHQPEKVLAMKAEKNRIRFLDFLETFK